MDHSAPPRPSLQRPRPLLVALILAAALVVVVVAAAVLIVAKPFGGSDDSSTPTIWQTIANDITDQSVPPRAALEAFAYLYGVSIPRVTVPTGRDVGAPTSGTEVTRWVLADWPDFASDQQAVIGRYLPGGITYAGPAASSAPTVTAAAAINGALNGALADEPPRGLEDDFANELDRDLRELGPRLGLPIINPYNGSDTVPELLLSDEDAGHTLLTTYFSDDRDNFRPCHVVVWKNTWANEQATPGQVSARMHVLITHEAVHCYQQTVWADVPTNKAMPDWIAEGTAAWLAGNDTGIVEPGMASWWRDGWFTVPDQALTTRTYDAVGYFALLDHLGRNLWSLMAPAWEAARTATGSRSDAFIAVLNGDADDVRDVWASSLLQHADWSDEWVTHGFGVPSNAHVNPHPIAGSTSPFTGKLESRSAQIDLVESSDGEIVQVDTSGLFSAHDAGTDVVLAKTSDAFCTVPSCVCPPGTVRAGEDLASQHMDLPFYLAFNAPEGGSTYAVTDMKLSDACGAEPSTPPSGGGGGGRGAGPGSGGGGGPTAGSGPLTPDCGTTGCAGDNGDPHLTTVDGQHYDFQAAGEFVLLRSADGATEIQGRQEPFQGSDHVAINTAVAMRVGSHRVMVDLAPPNLAVRVDGQAVDPAVQPVDLGSGAAIVAVRNGFEVDLPDGTRVWLLGVGNYGLNLQIHPSEALKDGATGILGRLAGRASGLPPLPDGTSLPPPSSTDLHATYVRLYQTFADAWRVTDATSLFEYRPRTSTATYTKSGFPAEGAPTVFGDLSPTAQADGLRQCTSITNPELQQECAYDVSVTGNPGFGGLYQATEPTDQGAGPSPAPTPGAPPASAAPSSAGSTPPGHMVAPGIPQLLDGADQITGGAIGPDDSLYVSLFMADSSSEVVTTGPRGLAIAAKATIPSAGIVAVTAGSVWVGEKPSDGTCAIARLDPMTLALQATVPIACLLGTPTFAAHDGTIWFIDSTTMDVDLHGAVLRRIDPATNVSTNTSIPMASANGYIRPSSDNSSLIFATNSDAAFLPAGGSAFTSLGKLSDATVFAADNGAWTWTGDTNTATLSGPNGAITVLPEQSEVIGADQNAIYACGGPGSPATSTLWRYPADGSPGQQIATGATVPDPGGTVDLGYFDDWPFVVANHVAVKFWLPRSPNANGARALDIQWTPVP